MKPKQPVKLSTIFPKVPEGEKLTATDKGIEVLDHLKWNPKNIRFLNLQSNNVESLRGLGQFPSLQGIDFSNNNVE